MNHYWDLLLNKLNSKDKLNRENVILCKIFFLELNQSSPRPTTTSNGFPRRSSIMRERLENWRKIDAVNQDYTSSHWSTTRLLSHWLTSWKLLSIKRKISAWFKGRKLFPTLRFLFKCTLTIESRTWSRIVWSKITRLKPLRIRQEEQLMRSEISILISREMT